MENATVIKKSRKNKKRVGEVFIVPVDRIKPYPNQPRNYFDKAGLMLLAESIKANGQVTPALVKKVDDDTKYRHQLIDGQRRWHAIQMAGLANMTVLVKDKAEIPTEFEEFKLSVMSNFGRAEHTPIEIAQAIQRFRDEGLSLDDITNIFAKSRAWVDQHLKILQLVAEVLEMMDPELPKDKQLSYSVAVEVASLPKNHQLATAKIIITREMKLNTARHFVRDLSNKLGIMSKGRKRKRGPDDDFRVLHNFIERTDRDSNLFTERLQEFFNTLFLNRSEEDPVYMLNTILKINESMGSLAEKIREALKNKKARQ